MGKLSESGKYKTVRITGKIKEGATGEPLTGAKIIVENTDYYSISGYNGDYVLEIPAGIYTINVLSMGFEDKTLNIKAISPGILNIEMFEESHAINEVLVTSEKSNKNVHRDQMSILEMNGSHNSFIERILDNFGQLTNIITAFCNIDD